MFELAHGFRIAQSNMAPMIGQGVNLKNSLGDVGNLMDDLGTSIQKSSAYLEGTDDNINKVLQMLDEAEQQRQIDIEVDLEDFEEFFKFVNSLNIPVKGLMCLPPKDENPSIHFCILKELANKFELGELSMGMSMDFEKAINFGSTYLRIGSAFFGKRN